jgi:hypothetical protein
VGGKEKEKGKAGYQVRGGKKGNEQEKSNKNKKKRNGKKKIK